MTWSVLGIDQSMCNTGFGSFRHGDKSPTWGTFPQPYWGEHEGKNAHVWFEWLGHKIEEVEATHLYLEQTFNPNHDEALTNKLAQYGQILLADMAVYLINRRKGRLKSSDSRFSSCSRSFHKHFHLS